MAASNCCNAKEGPLASTTAFGPDLVQEPSLGEKQEVIQLMSTQHIIYN